MNKIDTKDFDLDQHLRLNSFITMLNDNTIVDSILNEVPDHEEEKEIDVKYVCFNGINNQLSFYHKYTTATDAYSKIVNNATHVEGVENSFVALLLINETGREFL